MGGALVTIALLVAAGALAIWVPAWLARRRLDALLVDLPEALETVARSLRAGHGLAAGLATVATQTPSPTSRAFHRAWTAQNTGVPVDRAVRDAVEPLGCVELRLFAMAVAIHHELGGDLAEVTERVAGAIRARRQLAQEVRALGAQGRAVAWLAGAMPFVMALVLSRLSPHYLDPLWRTETGHTLAAAGLLSLVLGVVTLRAISSVRV